MKTSELSTWLLSNEGIVHEIAALRRWSARRCFGPDVIAPPLESDAPGAYSPAWARLLLASSILAESDARSEQEIALMIAQAALVYGPTALIRDAGAVVLSQLSNRRTVDLAVDRSLIRQGLQSRLGVAELLLRTRRELETTIAVNHKTAINGSEFQFDFWSNLNDAEWTSATAPTAAGKTYLVLNWFLREVEEKRCRLGVFLAPTRSLVGEIEKQLLELAQGFALPDLRIASLPIKQLGDRTVPTILVFTQERLHLFLNAFDEPPAIDIEIVDEAQKLNDGSRGVILQDAIERTVRANESCRFVFLTPHAKNPDILLDDAPELASKSVVPGTTPTVTQNLVLARQVYRKPQEWTLSLFEDRDSDELVGTIRLHERPANNAKRLSYVALALGRHENGTLVYANGAADAEKVAQQIYDGLLAMDELPHDPIDEDLQDLSDFCQSAIHSRYLLVKLVRGGVAFHYGNMPTILRNEIERLFRIGKIRFLVCTSTLVEGVNLACRTIVMRGPTKGKGKHMTPQDFWNLAGRAGRWGADFHGNIVCVDPHVEQAWPHGVPEKTAYPIARETDVVLSEPEDLAAYITDRSRSKGAQFDERLEPVSAYLMAWFTRNKTISNAPSVLRAANDQIELLDSALRSSLNEIVVPEAIVNAHPGITALSMQALLNTFERHEGPLDYLLPPYPGDEDIVEGLKSVFAIIDSTLAPVFQGEALQWAAAYTTRDWIRGKKLGMMISGAIQREKEKTEDVNYAKIIRNTMRFVEEFARFKAPKYLSAYLDLLRFHYEKLGRVSDFPSDLPFDLYLEFGVNTSTLLSFLGLGLSRTSAIEVNEFLSREDLDEKQALDFLASEEWEAFDLPKLVKREIREVVDRRGRARLLSA